MRRWTQWHVLLDNWIRHTRAQYSSYRERYRVVKHSYEYKYSYVSPNKFVGMPTFLSNVKWWGFQDSPRVDIFYDNFAWVQGCWYPERNGDCISHKITWCLGMFLKSHKNFVCCISSAHPLNRWISVVSFFTLCFTTAVNHTKNILFC